MYYGGFGKLLGSYLGNVQRPTFNTQRSERGKQAEPPDSACGTAARLGENEDEGGDENDINRKIWATILHGGRKKLHGLAGEMRLS